MYYIFNDNGHELSHSYLSEKLVATGLDLNIIGPPSLARTDQVRPKLG